MFHVENTLFDSFQYPSSHTVEQLKRMKATLPQVDFWIEAEESPPNGGSILPGPDPTFLLSPMALGLLQ